MARVTRTIKRLYDAHQNEDFSVFDDGLNPKQNMEWDQLEHKLMDYIDGTLTQIEKAFDETEPDNVYQMPSSESFKGRSSQYEALIGGQFIPGNGSVKSFVDQNLARILDICARAGAEDPNFRIERVLDCHGVSSIIISKDGIADNGDSTGHNTCDGSCGGHCDGSKDTNSMEEPIRVVYICESDHTNDEILWKLPYVLSPPTNPSGRVFDGWYFDEDYSNPTNDVIGYTDEKVIYVYAKFLDEGEAIDGSGSGNTTAGGTTADQLANNETEKPCFKVDLWILQIILIILQIIDILITIMSIAMYIMATVTRLVHQAASVWHCPPALAELIADVVTGLIPLIFKIIAMLILKLLSSLQLDCISNNAFSIMARIFAILAGCKNLINSISQTAVSMKGLGSAFSSLVGELKNSAKSFGEQFAESFQNLGDDLGEYFSADNISKLAMESALQADGASNLMADIQKAVSTGVTAKNSAMDIKNAIDELKGVLKGSGAESEIEATPIPATEQSSSASRIAKQKADRLKKKEEEQAAKEKALAALAAEKAEEEAKEAAAKNCGSANLDILTAAGSILG